MDTMSSALLARGYSEQSVSLILRAHRASTRNQYQSVWSKFLSFLDSRNASSRDVSVPVVCDFLALHCTSGGKMYRTITVYKSALRHPLLFACGLDLVSEEARLLMRGVFNHRPPQRAAPMPLWSLNGLLCFLQSDLFEPLQEVPVLRLLQKTLALLLLSSGRRIGDVANMSRHSSPGSDSTSLSWLPGYLPKVLAPAPSISPMSSPRSSDRLLCPVRAYDVLLERSQHWLGGDPRPLRHESPLWIDHLTGASLDIPALSRMFCSLVKDFRRDSGLSVSIRIGPHQMRKLAASYARQVGHEEGLVQRLMGFSSPTILRKNYLANVPPLVRPCVLPGGSFIPSHPHDISSDDD